MGGDFQNSIPSKTKDSAVPKVPLTISGSQMLRFHKKGNEIHLHDDANNLKCAVPAAEWYRIAQNIRRSENSSYLDLLNKTFLRVVVSIADSIDLTITVESVIVGDTLKAISDFMSQIGV